MTEHILLFEGTCGRCGRLAAEVVEVSAGRLDAVRLTDPRAARWAADAGVELPNRPALVVLSGPRPRLLTGRRMVSALVRLLGPRRSMAVLRALGEDHAEDDGGRRNFLRTGLIGLGVVAGSVIVPGTAHARSARKFTPDEQAAIRRRMAGYDRMDAVRARLREHGFQLRPEGDTVGGTRSEPLVVSVYAPRDNDPARAAVLIRRVAGGKVTGTLEIVSGDPSAVIADGRVNVDAWQFTSVPLTRPGEVEPLSPAQYFACMVRCLASNCSTEVAACRLIPNNWAMLLCIFTFCNGPVAACHDECVDLW
ncbi:hypothetical protein [Actinomadura sp. 21ATH]|uniref:hypothetical protein n=1 Tax=Actinomadura sp. 21ATH TaxID=1735444 RepID=UPI0035C09B8F